MSEHIVDDNASSLSGKVPKGHEVQLSSLDASEQATRVDPTLNPGALSFEEGEFQIRIDVYPLTRMLP